MAIMILEEAYIFKAFLNVSLTLLGADFFKILRYHSSPKYDII